jgi:Fe2+ or Zn2+ uptake regulation protein
MDGGLASKRAQPGRWSSRPGCRHFHDPAHGDRSPVAGDRLSWALRECEKVGLRLTAGRRAILSFLAAHQRPSNLSRMERDERLGKDFDAATIYRTIMLLKDLKIVRQINADHKVRYFVLNSPDESGAYLLCECCGDVVPLSPVSMDEKRACEVARHGYSKLEHSVEVRGLCPRCQSKPGIGVPSAKLRVK